MTDPEKKGMGCWAKGCLILIVLAVVLGAVAGGGFYFMYRKARSFTSDAPDKIQVYEGSEEAQQALQKRLNNFLEALQRNESTILELSEEDINLGIAKNPQWKELRGRCYIHLNNNLLSTQASIPLDQVPGFSGRYLNGVISLDLSIENGIVSLLPKNIEVNGKSVSEQFMTSIGPGFQQSFHQKLQEDPKIAQVLSKIKHLGIEKNKLIIQTTGTEPSNSLPPPVEPVPVPPPSNPPEPPPEQTQAPATNPEIPSPVAPVSKQTNSTMTIEGYEPPAE
jgi:hypothetical protein